MNALSLFNGMGCGYIALKEGGHIVDKYYSSEIDKFAIKQNQLNFPDTIHLGSVTEWYKWECSDSQIYRMLGNGWTVDVIKHIFSYL